MYFGEEAWRHLITELRCPGKAALLLLPAVSCRSQTIRLFLTLKATAQAVIYGQHRCGYSMALWKRPTAASARFTGMRSSPEKRRLPNSRSGCRKARLTLLVTFMFPSKAL